MCHERGPLLSPFPLTIFQALIGSLVIKLFVNDGLGITSFNFILDLNIITWSCTGKIAASFGFDLVIWMPDSDATVVYRLEGITSLKHNSEGKMLAVGVKQKNRAMSGVYFNIRNIQAIIIPYVLICRAAGLER